ELVPEALVGGPRLLRELERVAEAEVAELRREVEQLAGDVLLGELEVEHALPVAQRLVQLAGLDVDDVRGELVRVAAEERVRERAVAQKEAGEVEADDEVRKCVAHAVLHVGERAPREEDPV